MYIFLLGPNHSSPESSRPVWYGGEIPSSLPGAGTVPYCQKDAWKWSYRGTHNVILCPLLLTMSSNNRGTGCSWLIVTCLWVGCQNWASWWRRSSRTRRLTLISDSGSAATPAPVFPSLYSRLASRWQQSHLRSVRTISHVLYVVSVQWQVGVSVDFQNMSLGLGKLLCAWHFKLYYSVCTCAYQKIKRLHVVYNNLVFMYHDSVLSRSNLILCGQKNYWPHAVQLPDNKKQKNIQWWYTYVHFSFSYWYRSEYPLIPKCLQHWSSTGCK